MLAYIPRLQAMAPEQFLRHGLVSFLGIYIIPERAGRVAPYGKINLVFTNVIAVFDASDYRPIGMELLSAGFAKRYCFENRRQRGVGVRRQVVCLNFRHAQGRVAVNSMRNR